MPVTIREVAKKLKLSITTVSRALDGYDDVAAQTRQRVIRTARAMGYVPSRAARQLRRQRADAIGYILPASGPQFTDPFFSEFMAGLGDEATSNNLDLLVSTAAPDTTAEKRHSSVERLSGYRLALERQGIAYREEYVQPGDFTVSSEQWYQSTLKILALTPRPTAIIASDDIVAAIVMSTLQRCGLRIPNDISVVGFDDQSLCTFLNPALTTVQLPIMEAGKRAGEILLQRIASGRTEIQHITLPCRLILRDSTGLCAQSIVAGISNTAGAAQKA